VSLAEIPLVLILIGLAAYAVLAGADFGAGFWELAARRDARGDAIREHAHRAMGPVWEANHVWLIFVLVVCWTAYPTAFGSIASTLVVPLFIAAIGIILRGTAYALRSGVVTIREERAVGWLFSLSCVLTPFALGAAIGGIASGRVPVGNAAGNLMTSWLNPTSIAVGIMAVVTSAYIAAIYLAADAQRLREPELVTAFRARALAAGLVAGAVAAGGLVVLRFDARSLFDDLVVGAGLPALVVSIVAGVATLALVRAGRYEPARFAGALAVAAIIAGWGLAQQPEFLPGLTVTQAAAGRTTLWATIIATAFGAVVLFPSLALLFGLLLRGRFDPGAERPQAPAAPAPPRPARSARAPALVAGVLGLGALVTLLGPHWAIGIGVVLMLGAVAAGVAVLLAPERL
jgi:cytochrome bd ubiquinol oxidase subunit II